MTEGHDSSKIPQPSWKATIQVFGRGGEEGRGARGQLLLKEKEDENLGNRREMFWGPDLCVGRG